MKDKHKIPPALLSKLNEHTTGGFVLFFSDKNGNPDWIVVMDNSVMFRGMMSYIEDTLDSVREIDKITRVSELSQNVIEEDGTEEE